MRDIFIIKLTRFDKVGGVLSTTYPLITDGSVSSSIRRSLGGRRARIGQGHQSGIGGVCMCICMHLERVSRFVGGRRARIWSRSPIWYWWLATSKDVSSRRAIQPAGCMYMYTAVCMHLERVSRFVGGRRVTTKDVSRYQSEERARSDPRNSWPRRGVPSVLCAARCRQEAGVAAGESSLIS